MYTKWLPWSLFQFLPSEFDQFLETRAKAADTLPPNHTSDTHQTKMEETDNTMFAL